MVLFVTPSFFFRAAVLRAEMKTAEQNRAPLPIQRHLPKIRAALETRRCAVIAAQPGAGKTTRVPLALLEEPWLENNKIILLEPRRLAAISCAGYMAELLNETVGETIGYHIRMDRKISGKTRIEVVTEGIFTRRIQNDPSLAGVGLVIFDEFHERNIHSDLGLALCLESFDVLRQDLRVLIMSATMDVKAVSSLMGDAPVIVSTGKSFPVETLYIPLPNRQKTSVPVEIACTLAIKRALSEACEDMLVFLPGVKEILRVYSILKENPDPKIHVYPLYGNLTQKEQAMAFCPSKPGERKIVLSTSIAETSITIDGVGIVIDAGLMRIPSFSPKTGMSRLSTIPVSKASADQRRGRAGRTSKGRCYRLWSEYDHQMLKRFTRPEILSVDLCRFVLELSAWGVSDPKQLKWLDLPDEGSFDQAKRLLKTLGALDEKGQISVHGKKMVSFGLHPRLAHMVITAGEKGQGFLACRIAALLNEPDILRFDAAGADPDIRLRLDIIDAVSNKKESRQKEFQINTGIVHRIIASERKMAQELGIKPTRINSENAGALLAHAYPDRIARKRNNQDNTFLMASGKGAFFTHTNSLSTTEYIVAPHLDGNPRNARIYLAAPYTKQDFDLDFCDQFKVVNTVSWDKKTGSIQAKEVTFFDKLEVWQRILPFVDPDLACDILITEIQRAGLGFLPWTQKLTSLKARALFLMRTGRFPKLPDVSDKALERQLEIWLKPFLSGIMSLKQLEQIDLESAFCSMLTWEHKQTIEKMAPTHITVPSGSKKPLKYSSENLCLDRPILEVRLQELFGLCSTPKIVGHTIPVTLHLLSPAHRLVQVTTDLESFWKNTYKHVKKDLMGRYPKHFWPDDPLEASPTNRAKPKKPVQ